MKPTLKNLTEYDEIIAKSCGNNENREMAYLKLIQLNQYDMVILLKRAAQMTSVDAVGDITWVLTEFGD